MNTQASRSNHTTESTQLRLLHANMIKFTTKLSLKQTTFTKMKSNITPPSHDKQVRCKHAHHG